MGGTFLVWFEAEIQVTSGSSGGGILNSQDELLGVSGISLQPGGVVHSRGPLVDCNAIKWIYDVLKANPSGATHLGDLHDVCLDETNCMLTMC